MTANVIVTVEREFDTPATAGLPGVDRSRRSWRSGADPLAGTSKSDALTGEPQARAVGTTTSRCATRSDNLRVTTDGVYTEFFEPDVFVSRERITGDPGIDPGVPLELRVEFTKMGRNDTLVRIIQGPYEPDVAGWHGEGWEKELIRLADYLDRTGGSRRPTR